MAVILRAPFPLIETSIMLPNPEMSDTRNQQLGIEIRRSMNNVKRTYIRRSSRVSLTYSFKITRMKALELRDFIEKYYGDIILMTNHLNETWRVSLMSNPFEFNIIGGQRTSEYVTLSITFEGHK